METTEKHAPADLSHCLAEMESAMAEWQCALLTRHLGELEKCTVRQRDLCRQVGELVLKPGEIDLLHVNPELPETAKRVREQGLRFAAILRRMRKNLETLRRALQGPSEPYNQPQAARVVMEL